MFRPHLTSAVLCAAVTVLVPVVGHAQGRAGFARGYVSSSERPNLLRDVKWEQKLDSQLPLDTPFVDEDGKSVKLGDYFRDRPVFLALVYYECPQLCTQVLNGLVKSVDTIPQLSAGKEFDIIALSFDPKESPGLAKAKKQAYLESYAQNYDRPDSERGFHFLTGSEESIRAVTTAVGFDYVYDPEIDQYAHAAGLTLLTPGGKVSKYFFGIEYGPKDLKFGVMEASEHRVGSLVDQVLLFCYHYDPSSGSYKSRLSLNLVRGGGVVTMLGMLTFWIVMWRRDHRHAV